MSPPWPLLVPLLVLFLPGAFSSQERLHLYICWYFFFPIQMYFWLSRLDLPSIRFVPVTGYLSHSAWFATEVWWGGFHNLHCTDVAQKDQGIQLKSHRKWPNMLSTLVYLTYNIQNAMVCASFRVKRFTDEWVLTGSRLHSPLMIPQLRCPPSCHSSEIFFATFLVNLLVQLCCRQHDNR